MRSTAPPMQGQTKGHGGQQDDSVLDCRATFQHIAIGCTRLIECSRAAAIAGDPRAIHTMRIELTRLRAAALFFSPMIRDAAWHWLRKELRWLNSALGSARDDDVTVSYAKQKRYRGWVKKSREALIRARDRSHRSLSKKLNSARYERLMMELGHWITNGGWQMNEFSSRSGRADVYSRSRLRDWRKRIVRDGRQLAAMRHQQLHRLRIRCKHYRYILVSLRDLDIPLAPEDLAFCDIVTQVHQALGDLRDLGRLKDAAPGHPPGYRKSKRKFLEAAQHALRCRPAVIGQRKTGRR
ncbi:MAG TPA: CHAD domain-containing protein [Bradyrhizobium sp.]|nr:CHAD domain-containing protein [Bradyrhizobium sp.]